MDFDLDSAKTVMNQDRYDNAPIEELSAFRSVRFIEHLFLGESTKWVMHVSPETLRAALWLVGQYAQLVVGKDVQEWYEIEAADGKWVDEYRTALWGFKVIYAGGHVNWPPAIDDRTCIGETAFHPEFDRRLIDQVEISWAAGLDQKACYALIWLCGDYCWSSHVAAQLLPSNFAVSESHKEQIEEILDLLRNVVDSGHSLMVVNEKIGGFGKRTE